ncbi:MAG: BatA domain-containing protein [Phycisphaerales bacterium]|nr:BatA domain-containing protein [Phycisphaerales bacterium]
MSFVHPGIAVATLGLALLPLLIHLINRRRYRREPWAAMIFLVKAHRRSQNRIRIDRWWLLALRTLAILLIGLTIARPYMSKLGSGRFLTAPQYDRVLIIDDGLSMQARLEDGRSAFDAAKKAAVQLIDKAQAGDGLGVITASSPPRSWMDQPALNRGAVHEIVASLQCSARTTDLAAAVRQASEILSRGNAVEGCREIYVLTDLSRASFDHASMNIVGGESTLNVDRLLFINVGPEVRTNLAVTNLRCDGQIIGAGVPVRMTWDVTNHGSETVAGAKVELRLGDRLVQTVKLDAMSPHAIVTKTAEFAFPRAGPHRVTATLLLPRPDVLEIDNTCHLAVQVAEQIPVLLVEGESGNEPSRQSLFYYRVALATSSHDGVERFFRTTTRTPGEMESEILTDYDVIALGDVRRLSEATWDRLAQWVCEGGGLIMFLGKNVQQENYERESIVGAKSVRLMPFELADFVRVDTDETIRFGLSGQSHSLLADFVGHDQGGLQMARVKHYWRTRKEPLPRSTASRTILNLSNSEPAMVASRVEKGRVLIWLTGANMDDSSLPAKPDYLPLMLNTTVFAATGADADRNVYVGDFLVQDVDAADAAGPGTVIPPRNGAIQVQPRSMNEALSLTFRDTEQPGFYQVNTGKTGVLFAVNINPEASDLRAIDEAELKIRFGSKSALVNRANEADALVVTGPAREFARVSMFILITVVLLETMIATSMGPRK